MPQGYDVAGLLREMTANRGNAFYVIDLTVVLAKIKRWQELLPRVVPFYAIKCNSDKVICSLLASAGCGFDCASQPEIEQVLDMGVPPENIIYANPVKQQSMLEFARTFGVRCMTADNVAELDKIAATFHEAEVVIRIAVDDSKSIYRFNTKFGAACSKWPALLKHAPALDINIVGVSFHVGSGCQQLTPFEDAVSLARTFFNLAEHYGYYLTLLDCGGGYPGTDSSCLSFRDVATTLSAALDKHFPIDCGVKIIAEPGRYMVAESHWYAVSVIAQRELDEHQTVDPVYREHQTVDPVYRELHQAGDVVENSSAEPKHEKNVLNQASEAEIALYINDGIYGSFNNIVYDRAFGFGSMKEATYNHNIFMPHVLVSSQAGSNSTQTRPTKLFGPTCCSLDVVVDKVDLPPISVGDWLYFANMGAYTCSCASRFNGQGNYTVHYVWSGP